MHLSRPKWPGGLANEDSGRWASAVLPSGQGGFKSQEGVTGHESRMEKKVFSRLGRSLFESSRSGYESSIEGFEPRARGAGTIVA